MMIGLNSVSMNSYQRPKPRVDTNNDQSYDFQELEEFSKLKAEKTGTSFDAEEVMAKYDVNDDGKIDESEKIDLKKDNAFGMEKPRDAMGKMMGARPPKPQKVEETSSIDISDFLEELESEEDSLIQMAIDAYTKLQETSETGFNLLT